MTLGLTGSQKAGGSIPLISAIGNNTQGQLALWFDFALTRGTP